MIRFSPRRGAHASPLDTLLSDPGTVYAAARALTAAGGGTGWWPYTVLVGTGTVMVHLAGLAIPEPAPPWSAAGHDAHVWIADRSAVGRPPTVGTSLVAIGFYQDMVAFVDATRAPGPLVVTGPPEQAGPVRALIAAQLVQEAPGGEGGGAYWPLSVAEGVISLTGLGIAYTYSRDQARRAAELIVRTRRELADLVADSVPDTMSDSVTDAVPTAISKPTPNPPPAATPVPKPAPKPGPKPAQKAGKPAQKAAPKPAPAPAPTRPPAAAHRSASRPDLESPEDFELWLRQVKEAAEAALTRAATFTRGPEPAPPAKPKAAGPDSAGGTGPARTLGSTGSTGTTGSAGATGAAGPADPRARDDPDDWGDTAVSSARP